MADGDDKTALDALDARVKAASEARQRQVGGPKAGQPGRSGGADKAGVGMRIAVEMVAGIGVGTFIGLMLDRWLGTKPWLLIVFFLLGSAAAFLNVYRVAQADEARRKAAAASGSDKTRS